MYGTLIIAYLFLGGTAGGAFLVAALWSLAFHRAGLVRADWLRVAFRNLRRVVYPLATAILVVAMVCLLWDLEHPERALLIFLMPRPTVLTFGAVVLTTQLALGVLLSLANLFRLPWFSGTVKRALEVACCVTAPLVMGYTGVFLYSNVGVPLWHTLTLVGLFFCSALSSGLSIVLLSNYFIQGQTYLLRAVRPLQKCHLVCLAAELILMVAYVAWVAATPTTGTALAQLVSPDVLPAALIGAVGFGVALPAALESYALLRKEQRAIPVSDFVCLIGALCLRWTVIVCGVH